MRILPIIPLLLGLLAAPAWGQSYQLVWQDEFDGTALDLAKWEPQIGSGCPSLCGWGNHELQYYRSENASVAGGLLTITARQQNFGGLDYTSARLRTRSLGDWTYGRIEMRAKLPIGRGIWPAFWMLPTDEAYGGWAASGEIDIMEYVGQQPNRVFGTLHYGGTYPENQSSSRAMTLASGDFHSDFHEFALEWEPCEMRWYVDGNLYATQRSWYSTADAYPAPFDQRFHLLLNLAVGGDLPGPPDGTTTFPQELVVDWVRVYQQPDFRACTAVFDGMDYSNPFANGWFAFNGGVGGGGLGASQSDLPPIDGCLASLGTGWGSGGTPGYFGGFGRTFPMDLTDRTHFDFWIHPDAGQSYRLEINLQDDDNGDNIVPSTPDGADDEFQYNFIVGPNGPGAVSGGGWQYVSIPLDAFTDDNSYHYGGNGVFDPTPVSAGGNGQLVSVVVAVFSLSGTDVTFRTDRWAFTRQTSALSGRVWADADGDGQQDAGEAGLGGVQVRLVDVPRAAVLDTHVTTPDGAYAFTSLLGNHYRAEVLAATLPAGVTRTADPDGVGTPDAFTLDLLCDQIAANGDFGYALPALAVGDVTPGSARLLQNAPNPFRGGTILEFSLAEAGEAELVVFDLAGRRVHTLARGGHAEGRHRVAWDGLDARGHRLAQGVYLCALRTADGVLVRRMALLP